MSHDIASKGIEYRLLSHHAFHRCNVSINDLSLETLLCRDLMQTVQCICVTKKCRGEPEKKVSKFNALFCPDLQLLGVSPLSSSSSAGKVFDSPYVLNVWVIC